MTNKARFIWLKDAGFGEVKILGLNWKKYMLPPLQSYSFYFVKASRFKLYKAVLNKSENYTQTTWKFGFSGCLCITKRRRDAERTEQVENMLIALCSLLFSLRPFSPRR